MDEWQFVGFEDVLECFDLTPRDLTTHLKLAKVIPFPFRPTHQIYFAGLLVEVRLVGSGFYTEHQWRNGEPPGWTLIDGSLKLNDDHEWEPLFDV